MDIATTLAEIASLSIEERLRLVGAIWDSIADDADQLPLTEPQRQELERRLADDLANPTDYVPWGDVQADLLARARR